MRGEVLAVRAESLAPCEPVDEAAGEQARAERPRGGGRRREAAPVTAEEPEGKRPRRSRQAAA